MDFLRPCQQAKIGDGKIKVASIDIGTNTIRCLIAEVSLNGIKPIQIFREIVRLGEGLRDSGKLQREPVNRALRVLKEFSIRIREAGVNHAAAVATSAVREGDSAGNFMDEAESLLGFPVEVITGEREAHLTALGVQGGIGPVENGIVVDIGGGSTEIVRLKSGSVVWTTSLDAGVVHLTEKYLQTDPPAEAEIQRLKQSVSVLIQEMTEGGGTFVGTAGTPTTLAALDLGIDEYDPTLVNGHVLTFNRLDELAGILLGMRSKRRLDLPGMEKGREDLIVAGILMLLQFMDHWGYQELLVSDWGLLEGVAIDLANRAMTVP